MEVVVDQGREQVVRCRDGMDVADQVRVDGLHRRHLGVTAARGPAFDAKTGAKRGFAQAGERAHPDPPQSIGKPDGGGRLALAGGRQVDSGDEDEAATVWSLRNSIE